jgi:hypothetical protein
LFVDVSEKSRTVRRHVIQMAHILMKWLFAFMNNDFARRRNFEAPPQKKKNMGRILNAQETRAETNKK